MSETGNSARPLKVFISYSRKDGRKADQLVEALEQADFDVTIDRRDLPYGEEWQGELRDFIQGADTVVWLVSPASVKSKWCLWELGEVQRTNKRLIPVMVSRVAPDKLPEALGRIHLLPADGIYNPKQHFAELAEVLNTDRGWLKEHTRLGDRARLWTRRGKTGDHLLRGSALSEAEAWRDRQPRMAPRPSEDVLDLILASRRSHGRRQRVMFAGSIAATIVALGLSAAALWQRGIAVENADAARQSQATLQRNVETTSTKNSAVIDSFLNELDSYPVPLKVRGVLYERLAEINDINLELSGTDPADDYTYNALRYGALQLASSQNDKLDSEQSAELMRIAQSVARMDDPKAAIIRRSIAYRSLTATFHQYYITRRDSSKNKLDFYIPYFIEYSRNATDDDISDDYIKFIEFSSHIYEDDLDPTNFHDLTQRASTIINKLNGKVARDEVFIQAGLAVITIYSDVASSIILKHGKQKAYTDSIAEFQSVMGTWLGSLRDHYMQLRAFEAFNIGTSMASTMYFMNDLAQKIGVEVGIEFSRFLVLSAKFSSEYDRENLNAFRTYLSNLYAVRRHLSEPRNVIHQYYEDYLRALSENLSHHRPYLNRGGAIYGHNLFLLGSMTFLRPEQEYEVRLFFEHADYFLEHILVSKETTWLELNLINRVCRFASDLGGDMAGRREQCIDYQARILSALKDGAFNAGMDQLALYTVLVAENMADGGYQLGFDAELDRTLVAVMTRNEVASYPFRAAAIARLIIALQLHEADPGQAISLVENVLADMARSSNSPPLDLWTQDHYVRALLAHATAFQQGEIADAALRGKVTDAVIERIATGRNHFKYAQTLIDLFGIMPDPDKIRFANAFVERLMTIEDETLKASFAETYAGFYRVHAGQLGNQAFDELLSGAFPAAEALARKGLATFPELEWIKTNLAHALMLQDRLGEADDIYLGMRGKQVQGKPWETVILEDFRAMRENGITHPHMNKIAALFQSREGASRMIFPQASPQTDVVPASAAN